MFQIHRNGGPVSADTLRGTENSFETEEKAKAALDALLEVHGAPNPITHDGWSIVPADGELAVVEGDADTELAAPPRSTNVIHRPKPKR